MNKPRLAILLEFGFHEIKKYIHSGFAEVLAKDFDIIWFALDKGNKDFERYFIDTGFPLIYLNHNEYVQVLSRKERINTSVRKKWLINKGLGAFHNHKNIESKSLKTRVIGSSFFKKVFEKMVLAETPKRYYSEAVKSRLEYHKVDILLLTGVNSGLSKTFIATALKMNLHVNYLVNSWKDLFINNFVPFSNVNQIFVWSEQMRRDYEYHLPFLNHDQFVISGNPTFDILRKAQPKFQRDYYSTKYGLPINADWLLYTMMPVGLVPDEFETILFIAREFEKKYGKEKCVFLVRRNPTHSADDFADLTLPPNVFILEHFCTYDKGKDMIVQSREGESEWVDLLLHASANIGAPSTVSLEFLALNKSIANIEFDSHNRLDPRVKQFFEAGFYKPLFNKPQVTRCKNINDVFTSFEKLNIETDTNNTDSSLQKASYIIKESLLKNVDLT